MANNTAPNLEEKGPVEPDSARVLNYHLMHPGGDSQPGDPNVAFFLSIGRINTVIGSRGKPAGI